MSYDLNLNPVIEKVSNEDLQYLVEILTGAMTNFLDVDLDYKKYYPDHQKYASKIADEIRTFGGNTFANLCRGGEGPDYKEIVCDVADELKAPYNKESDIVKIENSIIETTLAQALEKMSDEEKTLLLKELGINHKDSLNGPGLTAALITAFRMGGFMSYQLTVIVVNAVVKILIGRGLSTAANAALTKAMSILVGPIGWVITGIWALLDISGPAKRVTIPSVLYVAMLRKKYNTPVCQHCEKMVSPGAKFCPECGGKL